ncbi:MAG: NADH-quinone oxidoreductase subunit NuoK [Deltaproteobacteria bacterium]|nr:NADH-quinone oxidoreductase subunit NuoK [Deltaproteobacteria bacterium]
MTDLFWDLSISHFLALAAVLFAIGVVGALMRKNALIVLMSVELMLNSANLTLLAFARQHHDVKAHALAMLVIAVAAAEAAIGLAIVVGVFRSTRHANVDRLTTLRH